MAFAVKQDETADPAGIGLLVLLAEKIRGNLREEDCAEKSG